MGKIVSEGKNVDANHKEQYRFCATKTWKTFPPREQNHAYKSRKITTAPCTAPMISLLESSGAWSIQRNCQVIRIWGVLRCVAPYQVIIDRTKNLVREFLVTYQVFRSFIRPTTSIHASKSKLHTPRDASKC